MPERNGSSLGAFLPCFQEAADTGVVGRCLPSGSESGDSMPRSCPVPTGHSYGRDVPVCAAPHLEILTRSCCPSVWPFSGTQAHLLERWSSAAGRLLPAKLPWRRRWAGVVPSMGTADKLVCRRNGFLLLDVGSARPWDVGRFEDYSCGAGEGCSGGMQAAGDRRDHKATCFSN